MDDAGRISDEIFVNEFITELYIHFNEILRRKAYTIVKDYHRAEDAVQMTIIAMYKNMDKIEADLTNKSTLSYLYRTLEHKSYNILRDNKKYQYQLTSDSDEEDDAFFGMDTDEHIFENVTYEELISKIKQLPDTYSEVLIKSLVYGYSIKEISVCQKINEALVRQRIHRGREKLKKILEEELK